MFNSIYIIRDMKTKYQDYSWHLGGLLLCAFALLVVLCVLQWAANGFGPVHWTDFLSTSLLVIVLTILSALQRNTLSADGRLLVRSFMGRGKKELQVADMASIYVGQGTRRNLRPQPFTLKMKDGSLCSGNSGNVERLVAELKALNPSIGIFKA